MNDEQEKKKIIFKMTKSLLGEGWISNKQKREGKNRIVEYSFNMPKLRNLKKINQSCRPIKKIDPTTKEYTEYYLKFRRLK